MRTDSGYVCIVSPLGLASTHQIETDETMSCKINRPKKRLLFLHVLIDKINMTIYRRIYFAYCRPQDMQARGIDPCPRVRYQPHTQIETTPLH